MTSSSKIWKDHFLSSGLPLENDVKKALVEKGCVSAYEYSYFKPDENLIEKEFSYDLDAAYIKDKHFFEFMVECKYRHESTKWIFMPANYGGFKEMHGNDFLHAFDYFVDITFPYKVSYPIELAPACSKGIEITSRGNNEKSITQAIHQLSYAFAPKITSSIEHQVYNLLAHEHIFYHIPIIVTTAQLYRVKDDIDIENVKKASILDDIAEQHSILIMENNIGVQLEKYNSKCFKDVREKIGDDLLLEKNRSFAKNMSHFFSVMAKYYCPKAFIIMKYDKSKSAISHLFKYIDDIINPPDGLALKIKGQQEQIEKEMLEFEKDLSGIDSDDNDKK